MSGTRYAAVSQTFVATLADRRTRLEDRRLAKSLDLQRDALRTAGEGLHGAALRVGALLNELRAVRGAAAADATSGVTSASSPAIALPWVIVAAGPRICGAPCPWPRPAAASKSGANPLSTAPRGDTGAGSRPGVQVDVTCYGRPPRPRRRRALEPEQQPRLDLDYRALANLGPSTAESVGFDRNM